MPSDRQPVAHAPHEVAPDVVEGQWSALHGARMYAGHPKVSGTLGQRCSSRSAAITNEEDALLAVALGADALGFNFAPGSPRQVTPDDRRATSCTASRRASSPSGVFRDETTERVVEIVNTLGLGGAQLHGREPLSDVRWIRQRVPFVIQAFAAGDPALAAVGNGPVDIVLVDADDPGSGKVFDWALADAVPPGRAAAARGRPHRRERRRRRSGGSGRGASTSPPASRRRRAPVARTPRKLRRFIERARTRPATKLGGDALGPRPATAAPYDWMADGA